MSERIGTVTEISEDERGLTITVEGDGIAEMAAEVERRIAALLDPARDALLEKGKT